MNRLKQIRERKSFSLAQLAARTGIPLRVLTEYEENSQEIAPAHIKILSKVLWVKPDELVPPPGTMPAPGPAPAGVGAAGEVAATNGVAAAPAPSPAAAPAAYGSPRPAYPPPPAPGGYGAPRPPRPPGPPMGDMGRGARPAGPPRARREPPAMPATEGQMTEILRLAARLNRSTEAIETEFGRTLDSITRFDAREWIKKLREEAAASAPPAKVHFGTWPGLKDDREAVYLAELRESQAALRVVLFNGQVFEGRISDFTPYTLTVVDGKGAGPVIVRKLAIAYYQQTGENAAAAPDGAEAKDLAPFAGTGAPAFAGADAAPATAQAEVAPPAEAPAAKPRATRARKTAAAAPATDSGISGGEGAPSTADSAESAGSPESGEAGA